MNECISVSTREKLKIETYFPIIDMLINLETKEIQVHCKTFAEYYHVDINENELILKCNRKTYYMLHVM